MFALLGLLTSVACGDSDDSGDSDARRSSLAACSFSEACADAEEQCYVSQVCGPPAGTDAPYCWPEEGDRQCHRRCESDASCGPGEECREVELVNRTDTLDSATLCFAR
jgi:hypothetical protein